MFENAPELSPGHMVALCGGGLGLIAGWVARRARFCTFGAVEDMVMTGDLRRLKCWGLAIATAMLAVQVMHVAGVARIDTTFYLQPYFHWAGAIVGGFLFGIGMALIGTCGFGTLVRLGGGDLRAFVTLLVMGMTAYMTGGGITSYIRIYGLESLSLDLSAFGGQGIAHLIAGFTGQSPSELWIPVALILSAVILSWSFSPAGSRCRARDVVTGIVLGLTVAGGFAVTGILGNDPFEPIRVRSLSYVLPPGQTAVYLMTYYGSTISFGIALVFGTIAGSFAAAVSKRELRVEAYDDAREMRRHLLGAFLMGFGGVTAYGCTIGQGMSGISTLSMTSVLAMGSIMLGAIAGLYYVLSGSVGEAYRLALAQFRTRS